MHKSVCTTSLGYNQVSALSFHSPFQGYLRDCRFPSYLSFSLSRLMIAYSKRNEWRDFANVWLTLSHYYTGLPFDHNAIWLKHSFIESLCYKTCSFQSWNMCNAVQCDMVKYNRVYFDTNCYSLQLKIGLLAFSIFCFLILARST